MTDAREVLTAALADRYRVERELGAGGMATVYLAHDLKHDRDVAIKVLHPELGAVLGAERFLSEIRTTANLQHPNILPLFDSGAVDGLVFYVMPYVAGETLRMRISREGQLAVSDAVRLTQGVASALDYAHRHGVIHRDIKPENILLQDGQALVADFGIALAVSNAGGARITQTGISVGTPQYMSPEQAAAERQLDGRSDQYSLAAVLYEMLTGEPPFSGPSAPAILTKLMTEQVPALTTRRPSVPGGLADAVHRALEKVPADRFVTAAEFAEALTRERTGTYRAVAGSNHPTVGWRQAAAMVGVAVISVAVTALLVTRRNAQSGESATVAAKFQVQLPAGYALVEGNPAVSPDGRQIVFVADSAGTRRLMMRVLDDAVTKVLPGTEGATADPSPPFFSPDGRWVAFIAGRRIRKIDVSDNSNSIENIADFGGIETIHGGAWGDDGWLVLGAGIARGLVRVRQEGGVLEVIAEPSRARHEISFSRPEVLPGGKTVLFCLQTARGWSIAALSSGHSAAPKEILPGATSVRYLPSGQLLYSRTDGLFVDAFDASTLKMRGTPTLVANRLPMIDWAAGYYAAVGAADDRTLAYVDQPRHETRSLGRWIQRLVVMDRAGAQRAITEKTGASVSFAPLGQQLATYDSLQITTYDLSRNGLATRLTSGASKVSPVYSPDGLQIAYTSYETGAGDLYLMSASDGANQRLLYSTERRKYPEGFTPDGKFLLYREYDPAGADDIWMLPLQGRRVPVAVLRTPDREYGPSVSRDGSLLAFTSNRSGQPEVYLQAFPGGQSTQRVSTNGGGAPRWNRRRDELFYLENKTLMAVTITRSGSAVHIGVPRQLFNVNMEAYDVSPDGDHFAASMPPEKPLARMLTVVTNWKKTLREGRP